MSQSARVTSIDSIKDFRASLCRFGEDARHALGAVEMEIRRSLDWLTHDRPMYWQMEVKRRKEILSQAQAELFRRRLQAGPGREVKDTEQKELVRKAQRYLHEAEDKLATVRKWIPVFQHAVSEYQARTRPLGDMLDSDIRVALALLDRMATALDAYLATAPPSGSPREEAVGSSPAEAPSPFSRPAPEGQDEVRADAEAAPSPAAVASSNGPDREGPPGPESSPG